MLKITTMKIATRFLSLTRYLLIFANLYRNFKRLNLSLLEMQMRRRKKMPKRAEPKSETLRASYNFNNVKKLISVSIRVISIYKYFQWRMLIKS